MNDPSLTQVVIPSTVEVSSLAMVIHKIVRSNLLPHTGGGANFTFQDLGLVSIIMKGLEFNLASMILLHMDSCVKQNKKSLPYSGILTKVFQHFGISVDTEAFFPLIESIDSENLKQSHLTIIDGNFIRLPKENPLAHPSQLPNVNPPIPSSSPEIASLLHQVLSNQNEMKVTMSEMHTAMQAGMSELRQRLSALETMNNHVTNPEGSNLFKRVEDEFIDLQAGFEVQTTAMVVVMQRKMNRNTCQLSHEIKFISSQLGTLGSFVAHHFNDIGHRQAHSPVPDWPEINWMAEFAGDFLDIRTDPNIHIPRPPHFAHELSMEERIARVVHRPYFTRRAEHNVVIEDLDD